MISYNPYLEIFLSIIAGIIGLILMYVYGLNPTLSSILIFIVLTFVLYQLLSRLHPIFKSGSYQGRIYKIIFKNNNYYDTNNKIEIILTNVEYISSCPIPSKLEKGCWTIIWEDFPIKKRNSSPISLKVQMEGKKELIKDYNIFIGISNQLSVPIDYIISPPKDQYLWRGALEKIGIILSRNVFPITWKIVFIVFLTLVYLLLTPPIHIVLSPPVISENMSSDDVLLETISIKNLGTDITNVKFDVIGAAQIMDLEDTENITLTNILNNLSIDIEYIEEHYKNSVNAENIIKNIILLKDDLIMKTNDYNDDLLNYQNNITKLNETILRLDSMGIENETEREGFNYRIANIKNNISTMDKIISTEKNISIVILGNNPDTDMLFNGDIRFYHLQITAPDSPGEFRGEISITAKSNNDQKIEKIPVDIIVE